MAFKVAGAPNYRACIFIASMTTNYIHSTTTHVKSDRKSPVKMAPSFDLESSSPAQIAHG